MNKEEKKIQGASNRDRGAFAESLAAEYLIQKGYTIRERNYRIHNIEIDIIAQKENEIIFVEVKARSGNDQNPLDAVDKAKRRRIITGADIYLRGLDVLYYYRFDIITVTGIGDNYELKHYPDSYRAELRTRIHIKPASRLERKRPSKSENQTEGHKIENKDDEL